MKDLEINETAEIIVPALAEWHHSRMLLKANFVYRLEVLPPEQEWYDGRTLKPFTAAGRHLPHMFLSYPFLRMPTAKWFSLIGCIDKKKSSYFKIGTLRAEYSPKKDGELICFANDVRGFYKHNNEGSIKLYLTKIREK